MFVPNQIPTNLEHVFYMVSYLITLDKATTGQDGADRPNSDDIHALRMKK